MTKRQRKSLDDSLANNFVFGEDKPKTESATQKIEPNERQAPIAKTSETPTSEAIEIELEKSRENAPHPIAPITETQPTAAKSTQESSLMDKLQLQPKEATKRFTVDLSESMHRKLSILAAKTGRTKADIVRLLLEDALMDVDE
jgi:hypothetical protein